MKLFKLLPILLCFCLLTSCSGKVDDTTSPDNAPVTAIGNHKMEKDKLYTEETGEFELNQGDLYGIKFSSEGSFDGIELCGYSKTNDNATLGVRIYKWDTSYGQTMASNPIEIGQLFLSKEKADRNLSFFQPKFDAGEYLIVLEPYSNGTMLTSGTSYNGVEYFNMGMTTSTVVCVDIVSFT